MRLLFSYGTLTDGDIQSALFGRSVPSKKAILSDRAVFLSPDGYPFIKPEPGENVEGLILRLTADALQMADQWEEVPVYRREQLTVKTMDAICVDACVYTRRVTDGIRLTGSPLGTNDKNAIVDEARKMRLNTY